MPARDRQRDRAPRAAGRGDRQRQPIPAGFWPLWTTVALDLVGFGIVVPILARYAERFGASGLEVGLLFASYSLAQFICSPLLGRVSDRIGRKPVIIIALIGTAIGSLLTGMAGSLPLLFLGRVIDGASGASISVAQAAVTDIADPSQRPRLLGLLGAAFGIGFVVGPAIGGLASLGGPELPFYVAAAIAAINAVAAAVRLPNRAPVAQSTTERSARTPQMRRLATIGFIATAGFVAFETTFGLLGSRRFELTEGSTAVVFLGIGLVLVAVQGGLYGRAAERTSVPRLYLRGSGVLALGLFLMAAATTWWLLVPALALIAFGQGLASPAITTVVSSLAPLDRRGEAIGFQQSAYALARIVGPPVAGLLFDHVGVWTPVAVGGVLCLAAVAMFSASGFGNADVTSSAHGAPVAAPAG